MSQCVNIDTPLGSTVRSRRPVRSTFPFIHPFLQEVTMPHEHGSAAQGPITVGDLQRFFDEVSADNEGRTIARRCFPTRNLYATLVLYRESQQMVISFGSLTENRELGHASLGTIMTIECTSHSFLAVAQPHRGYSIELTISDPGYFKLINREA